MNDVHRIVVCFISHLVNPSLSVIPVIISAWNKTAQPFLTERLLAALNVFRLAVIRTCFATVLSATAEEATAPSFTVVWRAVFHCPAKTSTEIKLKILAVYLPLLRKKGVMYQEQCKI